VNCRSCAGVRAALRGKLLFHYFRVKIGELRAEFTPFDLNYNGNPGWPKAGGWPAGSPQRCRRGSLLKELLRISPDGGQRGQAALEDGGESIQQRQ
jgi:hypothetical protein